MTFRLLDLHDRDGDTAGMGPALARSIAGARAVDDARRRHLAELGHDPPPDGVEALGRAPTAGPD